MSGDRRGPTLVLGGSGFLGAHVLVRALVASERRARESQAQPERVISAGRAEPPAAVTATSMRSAGDHERAARVEWQPFDALHTSALSELFALVEPARVIVCTALSTIPECESYPGLARALNVDLPREVARRCAEISARCVLVSTDLVFGAVLPPPRGFDESAQPAPITTYGRTKAEGEKAVLAANEHALVVRLPLLFGDSFGRGLGASDRVLAAVERMLTTEGRMPAADDRMFANDSRDERPVMFTDEWRTPLDVARAAEALIELAHGKHIGIVHVAGPERVSRRELALRALVASGRSRDVASKLIASTTRAEAGLASTRPEDTSLDASFARTFLRTPLEPPSESLLRAAFERRSRVTR